MTTRDIRHDPDRRRFSVTLDAGEAYLQYRPKGEDVLDFVSTFVPPEHRHHGIGAAIVKHGLDYARENDYAVIPTCPFVTRVIGDNPAYQDLVAT